MDSFQIFPFILNLALFYPLITIFHKLSILDKPEFRSNHKIPVPRGGGIVFIGQCLCLIVYCILNNHQIEFTGLLSITVCFGIFSFIDDLISINSRIKLIFHLLFCFFAVALFGKIWTAMSTGCSILVYISLVMYCFYYTNAFNFMDGINGMLSIQVLVGSTFTLLFLYNIDGSLPLPIQILLNLIICFVLAFIPYNFPNAKIFLGDTGSVGLGIGVSIVNISILEDFGLVAFFTASLFYTPLLSDVLSTLMYRIKSKENLLKPHSKHLYQIIYRKGISTLYVNLIFVTFNFVISTIILLTIPIKNGFALIYCVIIFGLCVSIMSVARKFIT